MTLTPTASGASTRTCPISTSLDWRITMWWHGELRKVTPVMRTFET